MTRNDQEGPLKGQDFKGQGHVQMKEVLDIDQGQGREKDQGQRTDRDQGLERGVVVKEIAGTIIGQVIIGHQGH